MQFYPAIVIVNRVGYKERVKAVKRLQEGIESVHGLRMPREEIVFTAWPKIHSHYQIFRYGRSIFCLPHRPNFSDIFDLCLHWVSVVRALYCANLGNQKYLKNWADMADKICFGRT